MATQQQAPSKTMTSFYHRLYVAHLIDSGIDTVPAIMGHTGMPRRTAQDTIGALGEIGIRCEFCGAKKSGGYRVLDWGPIKSEWVRDNSQSIQVMLGLAQ